MVADSPSAPLAGAATVTRSGVSKAVYGFSIGGGVELKASEHLRLRTEYLYDQYKSVDITVGGAGFGGTIGDITTNSFVSPGSKVELSNQTVRLTAILPVLTQHGWVQASGAMLLERFTETPNRSICLF